MIPASTLFSPLFSPAASLPSRWARAVLLAVSCAAGAAVAQSVAPRDDTLYQQLGGQPGLVRLADDFMARLVADPHIQPFFKDTDPNDFKKKLVLQFCDVSGGPCATKNPDMKDTHADYRIRMTEFNAVVELLQSSMDAQQIPFTVQNRLLARLAPMHREIVNTK